MNGLFTVFITILMTASVGCVSSSRIAHRERNWKDRVEELTQVIQTKDDQITELREENLILQGSGQSNSFRAPYHREKNMNQSQERSIFSAEPETLYKQLLEKYKAKDFVSAQTMARLLLADHKDHELASSALYWLASIQYQNEQYPQALKSFNDLIRQYPNSPKLAEAYLGKALVYENLSLTAVARQVLDEVGTKFKNTDYEKRAELLKQRLRN